MADDSGSSTSTTASVSVRHVVEVRSDAQRFQSQATTVVVGSAVTTRESARGGAGVSATARVHVSEEEEAVRRALDAEGGAFLPRRSGVRLKGWLVETRHGPILKAQEVAWWEQNLKAFRLPEMVFGSSSLKLVHEATGTVVHFNAWDALSGWMKEKLPPVQIPTAVRWMQRVKPSKELLLDYDYTFTTTYCGSERINTTQQVELAVESLTLEDHSEKASASSRTEPSSDAERGEHEDDGGQMPQTARQAAELEWRECTEPIDWAMLQERDPILFYDEVVLYEDELADNGIALCSVKVRVMARCWFVLLRFWLRVDGVLMRLRDTRLFCRFSADPRSFPLVLRERSRRESTFQELAAAGLPADSVFYADPNVASSKLQDFQRVNEKLVLVNPTTTS